MEPYVRPHHHVYHDNKRLWMTISDRWFRPVLFFLYFVFRVPPPPEPAVDMPGHERQVRAGKVTAPEEYKRRFLVPAPKSVEWKTAYIDGRLHRRIAMLVRAAGCGSISGFIIRLLELHMEEHREDIAALLGEVYRPWDEDGQPGGTPRR